jgi:Tfp pilus assembly protein PilO
VNQRTKLILAGVACFLVALLFFLFFIRPRQGEIGRLDQAIQDEEARTQELQTELQRLQALRDAAPELQARLQELRALVPRQNEVPNFIFQVQEAADAAGVAFVQITPEPPKPPPEGAPLAEIRVQINAEGGYFSIQDFIRRLYGLDRAVRIDLFSLSGEQDTQTGELTVTLQSTARIFFDLPEGGGASAPAPAGTAPAEGTS